MNQMYVTMVARHFENLKVNLLCAIIDQRIEHNLPSLLLREVLLEEIERIQEEEGLIHRGQKKAYGRVLRDTSSYINDDELIITCLDSSDNEIVVNLLNNMVTCKSRRGIVSGEFQYNFKLSEEGPVRQMFLKSYKNDCERLQYITLERENIIVCNNWDVLNLLFTCTDHEEKIIKKTCVDASLFEATGRGDRRGFGRCYRIRAV